MKSLARTLFTCTPQSRYFLSTLIITFMLLACCGFSAQAAPGDYDVTFGIGGKVATPIGSGIDEASAVAIQPDGKIVIAGRTTQQNSSNFGLTRYNTDGSLDTTFGTGGKVITVFGNIYEQAKAVLIQSDGKIVAVGYYNNGTNNDFALARYNSDGSLDSSFGVGGKVGTIFYVNNGEKFAYAGAIQGDGKIVVAGYSFSLYKDFIVARYNTNGTLDSSFGTGGIVNTQVSLNTDAATSIALQSDGKIVVAGFAYSGENSPFPFDFALVRYNTDGSLDSTFGAGGKVTTPISGTNTDGANAVAVQPDGKIVVGGFTVNYNASGYPDFALARYNSNGSLDNTFGTGGKVITPFDESGNDIVNAVAIQPDGKIVAAGETHTSDADFAFARYNGDGSLDSTFGTGGKLVTPLDSNTTDAATAIAIQPDGKIVAAGQFDNNSNYDFAVVRLLGTQTTTTANAGDVIISEFRFNGPNGNPIDEFVELYNNTSNDIMVSDPAGGAGWLLSGSSGTGGSTPQRGKQFLRNSKLSNSSGVAASSLLIPNGTVLPAHRHFLIANSGLSLSNSGGINHAFPDLALTSDLPDNGGIALYASSLATGTRLDAVGFSSAGSAQFYEGTPLTPIAAAGAGEQYSFIRKINDAVIQDTNDNASDFTLISTTATVGGTAAALGAPGPENLFAPVYKFPSQISGQYLDPTAASAAAPNRVIESGLLKIRRTYTNNTGADVRRLRFRVFDLTTLNNTQNVPAPVADLRVVSSQTETLNTAFGSKTVLALTREEPPDQTTTALDGGLHSTLSADTVTLTNPLRAGQSINVGYWLRIVSGGRFRFFVNLEALP